MVEVFKSLVFVLFSLVVMYFFQLCCLFLVGFALGFEKGLPGFCPKVPYVYVSVYIYMFFGMTSISLTWYIWDR